jgi:hypothetical protein
VTEEGGGETRYLSIVVTHEGDWQILWQGPDASAPESAPEFDRRVVDEVTVSLADGGETEELRRERYHG